MEINLDEVALMLGEKELNIVMLKKHINFLEATLERYDPEWRKKLEPEKVDAEA